MNRRKRCCCAIIYKRVPPKPAKGASNLHMRFNLSAVKPGQVLLSKEVTGSAVPAVLLLPLFPLGCVLYCKKRRRMTA